MEILSQQWELESPSARLDPKQYTNVAVFDGFVRLPDRLDA